MNKLICPIVIHFLGLFGAISMCAVSLEEKIGQMIVVGFRGTDISNNKILSDDIKTGKIGGVILYDIDFESLFNYAKENNLSVLDARNLSKKTELKEIHYERNIKGPQQLKALTQQLQTVASQSELKFPLFISIDYEGGIVNRLSDELGFPKTMSQKALAKQPVVKVKAIAKQYASTLKEHGINYILGPVVDVEVNPNNPVIAKLERAFSADPKVVIQFSHLLVQAYEKQYIACSLKHFPGHGSSMSDSHVGFVDVTKSWVESELEPFRAVLSNRGYKGVTVMPAHIVNKQLDKTCLPATLSEPIIQLLRKNLKFNGMIISDDLQMKAIADHYDLETVVKKSILAGQDVLLFSNQMTYDPQIAQKVHRIILRLVESGEISPSRIQESFDRIQKLKKWISAS